MKLGMRTLIPNCELIEPLAHPLRHQPLPYYSGLIPAGFPSPAEDHLDSTLDLNELLIHRPAATFFARARDDSMLQAGIHDNDILVVDRSITARHGDIVIAVVDAEVTVKRLEQKGQRLRLVAANPAYPPIELTDGQTLELWGVVTGVVRSMRR